MSGWRWCLSSRHFLEGKGAALWGSHSAGRVWSQLVWVQIPAAALRSPVIPGIFLTMLEKKGDVKMKQKLKLTVWTANPGDIGKMEHIEEFCFHWFSTRSYFLSSKVHLCPSWNPLQKGWESRLWWCEQLRSWQGPELGEGGTEDKLVWRKWAPPGSAGAIAPFMGRPEITAHADRALILHWELS